jgi:hypothetical protein
MKIPQGIIDLGGSKKGCFSLIILIIISIAVFVGKINGSELVAALSIISTIYCASTAAVDMKNGGNNNPGDPQQ